METKTKSAFAFGFEVVAEGADAEADSDAGSAGTGSAGAGSAVAIEKEPGESNELLEIGDIVVMRFRESPFLGYVKESFGMKATIVPIRESDAKTCTWVKAGKAVTKMHWECIKVPTRLSDMKIFI